MSLLGAKIQTGFEPIPGYVLTKKLGDGGYGDVWSADAPGGLKKAIKFVYGTINEDRASGELKSLQRIRQVNHPFILSLERIEIVEGQLLIVTELAQCSMFERYLEYRERGFAGIPHDRLLAYLRDAADGLDFLCQKHELQHLDVKPGNLLLVSDRVKVADFGLVKDLHSMSQSLMGGLTPTYAAPEMFDGRPGRYSDQYSLAIVYQEMLTGSLPFRGRTTAQLANEHLNKAPNLESLPVEERPIIAKALSKRPQQRFADCREMVAALEMASSLPRTDPKENIRVRGWNPKFTTPPPQGSLPQGSLSHGSRLQPPPAAHLGTFSLGQSRVETEQRRTPPRSPVQPFVETSCRSMVIGIGGVGIDAVGALRQRYEHDGVSTLNQPLYFAVDTDPTALRGISDASHSWALEQRNVLHTPLKSPHYYRDAPDQFSQLSRRWLYNIPRSQLTEGVRPLGMLAFIDHAPQAYEMLGALVEELCHDKDKSEAFEMRIVASAMGGTGSAMVCEMGFLLRQIAEALEVKLHIELILTCAAPSASALGDLASASAIASLIEINHYFKTEGLHPELPRLPRAHSHRPPFDLVKMVYGGQCGNQLDRYETVKQIVDFLSLPAPLPKIDEPSSRDATPIRERGNLRVTQSLGVQSSGAQPASAQPSISNWLSTIRIAPFPLEANAEPSKASSTVFLKNLIGWVQALESAVASKASSNHLISSSKTLERLDFFVTDTFRVCNWNAQAWVRDVMRSILPDALSIPRDFRSVLQPSACSLEYLTELKRICPTLGVDLSESSISIQQLFERRFEKLLELLSGWMSLVANWPILPKLLEQVEERLRINSHSLFSVAKKLEERHTRISDAEQYKVASPQTSASELDKVEMEAIFHRLSGTMLLKFIDKLEGVRRTWTRCSNELLTSFSQYGNGVAQQKFGCTLAAFIQQPQNLKVDSLNRLAGSAFSDLILRNWINACDIRQLFPTRTEGRTGEGATSIDASLDTQLEFIFETVQNEFKSHNAKLRPPTSPSDAAAVDGTGRESGTYPPNPIATKTVLHKDFAWPPRTSKGTISLDAVEVDPQEKRELFDLENKIEDCIPYLAEFGDSLRLFLYTSEMIWYQLPDSIQTRMERISQVFLSPEKMSSYLVSTGTDLNIEELIDKVWMPTSETWQLVPRVLSRGDVEWIPFSNDGLN